MGIWLELGIFVVVLIGGIWQIRDAKRAHARSVAKRLAQQESGAAQPRSASDSEKPH